jgi:protein involved in polysaccharide export with SLBB domain
VVLKCILIGDSSATFHQNRSVFHEPFLLFDRCSRLCFSGLFANPAARIKQSTSVEGATEYKFDSGLRVLLNPDNSVTIQPGPDVVYVVGAVGRPGAYVLGEKELLLDAVSLAIGINSHADRHAKTLRKIPGSTSRVEILLDLRKLVQGRKLTFV